MATKMGTKTQSEKLKKAKLARQKRIEGYHAAVEETLAWTAEMTRDFAKDVRELENEYRAGVAGSGKVGWDEIQSLLAGSAELNHRQELFVSNFLRYRNAARAAALAGYKDPETASGYLLYMHPSVRYEIQRRIILAQEKHAIDADAVIKELAAIAFANLDDFVELGEKGDEPRLTLRWASRTQISALKEINSETYLVPDGGDGDAPKQVVKKMRIQMHDKLRALEHLSKLLNLYPDDKPQGEGTRLAQAIMDSVREMKRLEGMT